jgi:hypothetical protein
MHSCSAAHCLTSSQVVDFPSPLSGSDSILGFAFDLGARQCIRPNRVQLGFAYGLVIRFRRSPPRLSTTQLPSTTDRPVFLSDGDFHPIVVRTLRRTDLAPTEPFFTNLLV